MKREDIAYQPHWGDYILKKEDVSSTIKFISKDHGIYYILTSVLGESLNKMVLTGLL